MPSDDTALETDDEQLVADDSPSEATSDAPEPEAPSEPAASGEPAPPPEPDYFGFFKEKAGVDFSTKYKTAEDLAKGVGELYRTVGKKSDRERELEDKAKRYEQVAPYLPHVQQWLQSQQQPAPQPEAPPPLFQAPRLEDGDLDFVERTAEGTKFKDHTPPDVRKRLLARAQFDRDFATDPGKLFAPAFERYREEAAQSAEERAVVRIRAMLQQEREYERHVSTVNSLADKRRAECFEFKNDRPVIDANGRPVPTEYGRHYVTKLAQLESRGITDPALADELAHDHAAAQVKLAAKPGTKQAKPAKPGQAETPHVNSPRKGKAQPNSLAAALMADNEDVPDDADVAELTFKK
jgi:hypothetical protein